MGRVVLVTGVSRELGRRFATAMSSREGVDRVIGVDIVPPRGDLARMQFVRADIRTPVIAKVIAREEVDTVVHLGVHPPTPSQRTSVKELNVIGTMQLLAACQRAESVRHFVLGSHGAVYGATPRDPAMFTEDMDPRRLPRGGFAKDVTEVEAYVRGFARRRSDVRVTVLRTASLIGPTLESRMGAYFSLPVVPTVLGFDARLQLLHETDMLAVLEHATLGDVPGVFNVAGDGVITLSQAVRRTGRPTLPLPGFAMGSLGSVVATGRAIDLSPDQVAFLTHGRGLDTTRMREVLGFTPDYSTAAAFEDFRRSLEPGLPHPGRVLVGAGAPRDPLTLAPGGDADG